jgi:hypothetical protein
MRIIKKYLSKLDRLFTVVPFLANTNKKRSQEKRRTGKPKKLAL